MQDFSTTAPLAQLGPQLQWINPLTFPAWDELLLRHPDATVFHSAGWAKVLNDTYEYSPHYLVASENNQLDGLLPIMEVRSRITGKRGVSLPFTDACPPLVTSRVAFSQLFQAASQLAKEKCWKYLELRGVPGNFAESSLSFYEHDLELTPSPGDLLAGIAPSTRRAIRKAQSAGLAVQWDDSLAAIERYYELHQLTRQKHGIPPQPFSFFKKIHQNLFQLGRGKLIFVLKQNQPLAAGLFFIFGQKAIYKFGASDPRHLSLRPNNYMMWNAIEFLKRHGCTSLSFGRTGLRQDGLRRFKLGFGATEKMLPYVKYNPASGTFLRQRDQGGGIAARLFRFCPKFLVRRVGTILYPHLG